MKFFNPSRSRSNFINNPPKSGVLDISLLSFYDNNEAGAYFDGVDSRRWSDVGQTAEITGIEGSPAGSMEDLSANGNHFNQGGGALRMTSFSDRATALNSVNVSNYAPILPPYTIAVVGKVNAPINGHLDIPVGLVSGTKTASFDLAFANIQPANGWRSDNAGVNDNSRNTRFTTVFFFQTYYTGYYCVAESWRNADYRHAHSIAVHPTIDTKLFSGNLTRTFESVDRVVNSPTRYTDGLIEYGQDIDLPAPIDWSQPQLIVTEVALNGDVTTILPTHGLQWTEPYVETIVTGNGEEGANLRSTQTFSSLGGGSGSSGIYNHKRTSANWTEDLLLGWANHDLDSGLRGRSSDTDIYLCLSIDRILTPTEKGQLTARSQALFGVA